MGDKMRLKVLLPWEVLVDEEVNKVVAEAKDGSFCLLPRHVDFLAPLATGILAFLTAKGEEEYVACDEGLLVKRASMVTVSTRRAVRGVSLGTLKEGVLREFAALDEREKRVRSAVARLEAIGTPVSRRST
ncbi:MAG: F0F1 ATP synthase subunit epsilon [Candidatus Methanosuratincola sp.]